LVDTPSKDFSYELDIELRLFKPKAKKVGEEPSEDKREPFWKFIVINWKMWALFGYFAVIIIIAEIYNGVKG
jgi:hypothetical protein